MTKIIDVLSCAFVLSFIPWGWLILGLAVVSPFCVIKVEHG